MTHVRRKKTLTKPKENVIKHQFIDILFMVPIYCHPGAPSLLDLDAGGSVGFKFSFFFYVHILVTTCLEIIPGVIRWIRLENSCFEGYLIFAASVVTKFCESEIENCRFLKKINIPQNLLAEYSYQRLAILMGLFSLMFYNSKKCFFFSWYTCPYQIFDGIWPGML